MQLNSMIPIWGIMLAGLLRCCALAQEAPANAPEPKKAKLKLVRAEFARSPLVRHPAAICLDQMGRVMVAETYRSHGRGVVPSLGKTRRELDDLQILSLDDRAATQKKWLESGELDPDIAALKPLFDQPGDGRANLFTKYSEKVVILTDKNNDGVADLRQEFFEGFNQPLDGPVSDILEWDGQVMLACVPDIWLLEDLGGDAKADHKSSLAHGFGVKFGSYGHDLHGLTMGLDGRIYFAVGDRGLNVTTTENRRLMSPAAGAVLRCWPDGSDLQIVAQGLMDPQALAFDDVGNLFAIDSSCDSADKPRLEFVMPGADYGWDVSLQSLPGHGPWLQEKLWEVRGPASDLTQPTWVLPPVAHLLEHPSGLVHFPGIGLPESFRDSFLLCSALAENKGAIHAFRCVPQGAGFKLDRNELLDSAAGASDVAFGYDGRIYVADWGYPQPNDASRISTLSHPESMARPIVAETRKLMAEGFRQRSVKELCRLLQHGDQRVRLRAQFALVEKGPQESLDNLLAVVRKTEGLSRVHGLYAIGQLARENPILLSEVTTFLKDPVEAVRITAARVLGDGGHADAESFLTDALTDSSHQVRAQAALALGKLRGFSLSALLAAARENGDRDPFLRHAIACGLAGASTAPQLVAAAQKNESKALRLAVVLALRQMEAPEVAAFLDDPEPQVSLEAARAIYDRQIYPALPKLAAMAGRPDFPDGLKCDSFFRRVIAASLELGRPEDAEQLGKFVSGRGGANLQDFQIMALEALMNWDSPPQREMVWGRWSDHAPRAAGLGRAVLNRVLPTLDALQPGPLRNKARELGKKIGPQKTVSELSVLVRDPTCGEALRLEFLRALEGRGISEESLVAVCKDLLLTEPSPSLRVAARAILARQKTESALHLFNEALAFGSAVEKQAAVYGLVRMKGNDGEKRFMELAQQLPTQSLDPSIQVEVLEILRKRDEKRSPWRKVLEAYESVLDPDNDLLAAYRPALVGGEPIKGRQIFYHDAEAQCIRCHSIAGRGGVSAPDLLAVSRRLSKDRLMESLVLPSARIGTGYATVTLTLKDGSEVTGVLQKQDNSEVVLIDGRGRRTIPRLEILEIAPPSSAMPPMGALLTLRELRDVLAFLESL